MADIRPVFKARVSSIEGGGSKARVIPLVGGDVVTRPLALHWSMRGGMTKVLPGDLVVCARFEDGDGIVLCRADGDWAMIVPDPVTFEEGVTGMKGAEFREDVSANGVSVSSHTHTGVHGETGWPH